MSFKTYKLETINHAIEIASCLTKSWFRGHPLVYGTLTPSLYRPSYTLFRTGSHLENFELELTEGFKRGAPTLTNNLPDYEDNLSWLFLMQHHGLPTRLLDWSQNILVALYFSVSGKYDEDAELWAINPESLNKKSYGFYGIPLPNNPILEYLIQKASLSEIGKENFLKEKNIESKPTKPIALQPVLNFPRMTSQMSTFTLHGEPDEEDRIENILNVDEEIIRYVIPKSKKKDLLGILMQIGIRPVTLFPDLDRLSQDLIKRAEIFANNPPPPPKCGGEI